MLHWVMVLHVLRVQISFQTSSVRNSLKCSKLAYFTLKLFQWAIVDTDADKARFLF